MKGFDDHLDNYGNPNMDDASMSQAHEEYLNGLDMQKPAAENAFGKPVPTERLVATLDCAVEIIGVEAMLADPVIRTSARHVERDEIYEALTVLQNIVDLTGAYRLLAIMCTDQEED